MNIIIYYLLLLVLLGLIGGYAVSSTKEAMSMIQAASISGVLILYAVIVSLVGEIRARDERELGHRYAASRHAFIAGVGTISLALLYDLFKNHHFNAWMLTVLIVMNLTKIISLIYQNYKK